MMERMLKRRVADCLANVLYMCQRYDGNLNLPMIEWEFFMNEREKGRIKGNSGFLFLNNGIIMAKSELLCAWTRRYEVIFRGQLARQRTGRSLLVT